MRTVRENIQKNSSIYEASKERQMLRDSDSYAESEITRYRLAKYNREKKIELSTRGVYL